MQNGEVDKQHAFGAGICGIFSLLCGVGDLITGIVWVATFSGYGFSTHGFGIWSGIFLIIAGALGIAAWAKRQRGLMIGFLVMCILACIVASIQALYAGIAHALWSSDSNGTNCYKIGYECRCINNQGAYKSFDDPKLCELVSTIVNGLLAFIILSVFGAIFTLAGSIIGCMVACGSSPQSTVVVIANQPAQSTVVMTQTHQAGVYPQQNVGYVQQPAGVQYAYPQALGYPQTAVPPQYTEKAAA